MGKNVQRKGKSAGRGNNTNVKKSNKNVFIISGVVVLLIVTVLVIKGALPGDEAGAGSASASALSDLTIVKNEITETAKFYPYEVGGQKMEILAIKASDGSVRTAFNTCQVCNGSPRAYYKQQGDALVCQNCGNRFSPDMVEVERGGCNPIPIMKDEKTDDGTNITISKDFITANKGLFTANWKKQ